MKIIEAEFTEENFAKFGEAYEWAIMFKDAGLNDLPDPDDEFDEDALEDWLVRAMESRGATKESALAIVRKIGGATPTPP